MKHKLSVHRFRESKRLEMEKKGLVDEELLEKEVYEYAVRRKKEKNGMRSCSPVMYDVEEQKKVLSRMIKRGCSSCEKRRQERWIEKLEKGEVKSRR